MAMIVCSYVNQYQDEALFREVESKLRKGIDHVKVKESGLVYNDPENPQCVYGFTDIVKKTGNLLFSSLLYYKANFEMYQLCEKYDMDNSAIYKRRYQYVKQSINKLWNEESGMFWAADIDCKQIDIWGSAYAVEVGVTSEEKKEENPNVVTFSSSINLFLKNGYVKLMVISIFLYVGAEVSMSSGVPILLKESFGMESFGLIISWALFFLPILLGRFVGSAILRKVPAKKFLMATVSLAIVGVVMLLLGNKFIALTGVVFVGLGFANIFLLVFSITVDDMPERTNELSGLMVTAIVGGAILPPIMGIIADNSSVLIGFVVPLLAMVYILYAAFFNLKRS